MIISPSNPTAWTSIIKDDAPVANWTNRKPHKSIVKRIARKVKIWMCRNHVYVFQCQWSGTTQIEQCKKCSAIRLNRPAGSL
jgi:hypothetical protein